MRLHGKQLVENTVKAEKLDFVGFTPTQPYHPITKEFFDQNGLEIAAASAPYLSIQNRQLSLKALAVIDVQVDNVALDLAEFIAASYTNGNEFQEGDTIILSAATGGTKIYMHNGGTAGNANDFTEIERPPLEDGYIRSLFSGTNGVDFNPAVGVFALNTDYARGLFSIGSGLSYNPLTGQFANTVLPVGSNGTLQYAKDGALAGLAGFAMRESDSTILLPRADISLLDRVTKYDTSFIANRTRTINSVFSDYSGSPFVGSDSAFFFFHQESATLYVCVRNNGLYSYNFDTKVSKRWTTTSGDNIGPNLPNNDPNAVFVDGNGVLWAGAQAGGGLWRYDTATKESKIYTSTSGDNVGENLNMNGVRYIAKDEARGLLWVACYGAGGGVWRYDENTNTGHRFTTAGGGNVGANVPNQNGNGIAIHPNGTVFLSTWGGGIWVYNQEDNTSRVLNTAGGDNVGTNLMNNQVWAIKLAGDTLFASAWNVGLWRYDTVGKASQAYSPTVGTQVGPNLPNILVTVMEYDQIRSRLIVPTFGGGIWVFNPNDDTSYIIDGTTTVIGNSMPNNNLWCAAYDESNGAMMVSPQNQGIWQYGVELNPAIVSDYQLAHKKFVEDKLMRLASEDYVTAYVDANKLAVSSTSSPYLSIANNEITLRSLAITDVSVDTVSLDLAEFIAASYQNGDEFQEGDTVILNAATGGAKIYLHNGGTAGDSTDFTVIERPPLDDAYIRALFSGTNGISYNVATGAFSLIVPLANKIPVSNGTQLVGFTDFEYVAGGRFKGGNNNTVSANYSMAWGDGNLVNKSWTAALGEALKGQGANSFLWGWLCETGGVGGNSGNSSMAGGSESKATGINCVAMGLGGLAQGNCSFAFGQTDFNGFGLPSRPSTLAAGLASFNVSFNSSAQTSGHGALARESGILSGRDHNIPSTALRCGIFAGNAIKAADSVTDTVYFPKIRIGRGTGGALPITTTPVSILAYNNVDGQVYECAATGFLPSSTPRTTNLDQHPSSATVGDDQSTGIVLAANPKGFLVLAINGKIESIGNGVKTSKAYFSNDGGTTARTFATIAAGDTLYWNGTLAGYDLDVTDSVDFYYL